MKLKNKFYLSENVYKVFQKLQLLKSQRKGNRVCMETSRFRRLCCLFKANSALCPTDNTVAIKVKEATKKGYTEATNWRQYKY